MHYTHNLAQMGHLVTHIIILDVMEVSSRSQHSLCTSYNTSRRDMADLWAQPTKVWSSWGGSAYQSAIPRQEMLVLPVARFSFGKPVCSKCSLTCWQLNLQHYKLIMNYCRFYLDISVSIWPFINYQCLQLAMAFLTPVEVVQYIYEYTINFATIATGNNKHFSS